MNTARSAAPPRNVLQAFGVAAQPVRIPHGRRTSWSTGDAILKPVDDVAQAAWIADLAMRTEQSGFRLARPIATRDGSWVVEGWSAWSRVEGTHSTTRWAELLGAAEAFHGAVAGEAKPDFIDGRTDRWRVADRMAWGEQGAHDPGGLKHLDRLLAARRPLDLPSQLVHGDLVGNVLFPDGSPPAIIDLSLYWRPPGYSAALVVGDAIAWEGADASLVSLIEHFDGWQQLLLRAVIFRIVVSELARREEPWRSDITHEYDAVVELAVSLAG